MPQNLELLEEITRFLNNPSDPDSRLKVEKFRSESLENEKFFLEIERIWNLSSSAASLQTVNHIKSLEKAKLALGYQQRSRINIWWKAIAVSLLLLCSSYWIYQSAQVVYVTKTTSQHQLDSVKLSDGSTIILAENSELKYPSSFASSRDVFLIKGKAFFNVAKDPNRPFRITINESLVTVLGTSFNISMLNHKMDLSVFSGEVSFTPYQNGSKSVLTAGQAISYDSKAKELLAINAQNTNSWLTKELVFVDTPLDDVCKQLTAYYGVEIKLQKAKAGHQRLNANFKSQTLNQVLEVLHETYNIKIKRENNQISLITL